MKHLGRSLLIGCLLLGSTPLVLASNSLLIPASSRCNLEDLAAEALPQVLADCQALAEQGDSQAQFELADLLQEQARAEQDPERLQQALHWFEQASLQGHAEAQLRLGSMFYRGEGVPANRVQAYIVLKMASINGSDAAMDAADLVASQMTRSEHSTATQILGQIFRNYLLELRASEFAAPAEPTQP